MGGRFSAPTSLADALTATPAGHRPVAGGTDLAVGTRQGKGTRPDDPADLFTGPGRTNLAADELFVAVEVPEVAGGGSCYVRLEFRRQMEIAVVGATAVVRLEGDVVRDARIAITALAPTVRRVAAAEAA